MPQTAPPWLTANASAAAATSLRILVIVVLAIVARALLHRAIRRVVRGVLHEQGRVRVPVGRLAQAVATLEGVDEPAQLAAERRRQRAETLGALLRSAVTAVLGLIAVLMVLAELGLDLAPLLAGAGVAGVAVGFGAQSLVKDVLAGMFLLLEDQYGVGDVVDVKEASGTVEDVGLRITTLRDADGVVWYVRNGEILRVGNKSQGWAEVPVEVPLPRGEDPQRVTDVAQRTVAAMSAESEWSGRLGGAAEAELVQPPPGGSPRLRLVLRTDPARQDEAARELRRRLAEAFDREGARPPR